MQRKAQAYPKLGKSEKKFLVTNDLAYLSRLSVTKKKFNGVDIWQKLRFMKSRFGKVEVAKWRSSDLFTHLWPML